MGKLRLIRLSASDLVRTDDALRGYIEKGELTPEIIRGVIYTYLDPENCMTKTEIARSFGIKQTLPSTIMEGFYQVGGRVEHGKSAVTDDFIDALLDWIS